MALQHVLRRLEDGGLELMVSPDEMSALPEHAHDLDWEACRDGLVQDSDVLLLFDHEQDGMEDPTAEENLKIGMGLLPTRSVVRHLPQHVTTRPPQALPTLNSGLHTRYIANSSLLRASSRVVSLGSSKKFGDHVPVLLGDLHDRV